MLGIDKKLKHLFSSTSRSNHITWGKAQPLSGSPLAKPFPQVPLPKASLKRQVEWRAFRPQQKIVKRILSKDTDFDGVPDKWDCQPRNPYKQDTATGRLVDKQLIDEDRFLEGYSEPNHWARAGSKRAGNREYYRLQKRWSPEHKKETKGLINLRTESFNNSVAGQVMGGMLSTEKDVYDYENDTIRKEKENPFKKENPHGYTAGDLAELKERDEINYQAKLRKNYKNILRTEGELTHENTQDAYWKFLSHLERDDIRRGENREGKRTHILTEDEQAREDFKKEWSEEQQRLAEQDAAARNFTTIFNNQQWRCPDCGGTELFIFHDYKYEKGKLRADDTGRAMCKTCYRDVDRRVQ